MRQGWRDEGGGQREEVKEIWRKQNERRKGEGRKKERGDGSGVGS